jgi:hypothetical protein
MHAAARSAVHSPSCSSTATGSKQVTVDMHDVVVVLADDVHSSSGSVSDQCLGDGHSYVGTVRDLLESVSMSKLLRPCVCLSCHVFKELPPCIFGHEGDKSARFVSFNNTKHSCSVQVWRRSWQRGRAIGSWRTSLSGRC